MKILVAEDNKEQREQLTFASKRFIERGIHFTFAADGNEAVKACKGTNFDVVVLDFDMPNCSGGEAIDKIRDFNPECKFFLLTGSTYGPGFGSISEAKSLSGKYQCPVMIKSLVKIEDIVSLATLVVNQSKIVFPSDIFPPK